ncbi:Uncharacterised protein [Klebsiella pneumoniae]|nr:Uncharacterised protein [Klebsiella pneumoniae]
MDFNLKEFIGAIGGGLGMGFGVTGLIPVIFPSVIYTDYIAKCGAFSGAIFLSAVYLYAVWRAK